MGEESCSGAAEQTSTAVADVVVSAEDVAHVATVDAITTDHVVVSLAPAVTDVVEAAVAGEVGDAKAVVDAAVAGGDACCLSMSNAELAAADVAEVKAGIEDSAAAAAAVEEGAVAVTWDQMKGQARLQDPRQLLFVELFEQRYEIDSASGAFLNLKAFLGDYLVQDFDYRSFCRRLGVDCVDDEEAWQSYVSEYLVKDLRAATTTILQLAVVIAKAHGLKMEDWMDVNKACSDALHSVPACYQLQRALPGALSSARASRFLKNHPGCEDMNPWDSDEGKELFEKKHGMPWSEVAILTAPDVEVKTCCSGYFQVREVTALDAISIVSLEALRLNETPSGFPAKELSSGDQILWEVERALTGAIRSGTVIEADFYELGDEVCFISAATIVVPSWIL